jgi:hypothetical protein
MRGPCEPWAFPGSLVVTNSSSRDTGESAMPRPTSVSFS